MYGAVEYLCLSLITGFGLLASAMVEGEPAESIRRGQIKYLALLNAEYQSERHARIKKNKKSHGRFASLDILATDHAYRRKDVSSVLMEWVQPIENAKG